MFNPLLFLGAISTFSNSSNISFDDILGHLPEGEVAFAESMEIDDWDDYENYAKDRNMAAIGTDSSNQEWSDFAEIKDISKTLKERYPGYAWCRNDGFSKEVSEVSGHNPIELKVGHYSKDELEQAILIAGVQDKTNYGGCGPIAAIGVLDYFARYLGYSEIIDDVYDPAKRIALSAEVMSKTNYAASGGLRNSTVWPWDMANGFNSVILDRDLSICASYKLSMFGGRGSEFWNDVVTNIDEGLPVTMLTGVGDHEDMFSHHYSNVYGYETWVGIPAQGGDRMTKRFLKARPNLKANRICYCDAEALNHIYSGVVTFNPHYEESYTFGASDFAGTFVNDSGGGQYFFDAKTAMVPLSNGTSLTTERLRSSYIENQYLVMSPNRADAGTAYIDISFPTKASKISFDASAWSLNEGMANETFKLQYYDGGWKDHISINPDKLPDKSVPNRYVAMFPKDTTRVRFLASHVNPSGTRNKGRICLDNFEVRYNSTPWEA